MTPIGFSALARSRTIPFELSTEACQGYIDNAYCAGSMATSQSLPCVCSRSRGPCLPSGDHSYSAFDRIASRAQADDDFAEGVACPLEAMFLVFGELSIGERAINHLGTTSAREPRTRELRANR
jgi:hypothetical protein